MKKLALIGALTVIMVLALASTAFALGPGYIRWSADAQGSAAATPHQDYKTTTEKCAVCHSVHGAPNGVTKQPWITDENDPLLGDAQMLLRTPVADACSYCHIDSTVGGIQIYNGNSANYVTASTGYEHQKYFAYGCQKCHAVHGANTLKGGVANKILKNSTGMGAIYQVEFVSTHGDPQEHPDDDLQVTGFCTQCHKAFSDASEDAITSTGHWSGETGKGSTEVTYKNHPLKAYETTAFFAAGDTTPEGQVAWMSSSYCRSCHAAGETDSAPGVILSSFPHYTPGNYNFLVQSANAQTVYDDGTTGTGDVSSGHMDGICLRCHDTNTLDDGVGKSF